MWNKYGLNSGLLQIRGCRVWQGGINAFEKNICLVYIQSFLFLTLNPFSLAALHCAALSLSSSNDLSWMAIWQWAFQYGVMSGVSSVNCPTLDQTYWFLSVGVWIFWALRFCGRMITFSSSHWYFIIIVLLLPSFQTTTANCPSGKQLCYGCLSFPSYETVHVPGLL